MTTTPLVAGRPAAACNSVDADLFGAVPTPPVTPLEAVAAQINQAHADAQAYASKAVERALVAGDLLNQVKAELKHGEFGAWCKQHCPAISTRTIQDYMRVARELPVEIRSAAYLSLREALRLVADPEPVTGELLPAATATPDPFAVIDAQQRQIEALEARIGAEHRITADLATVRNRTARKELEQKGELVKFTSSIGADGKEYPRQVERKAPEPDQDLEGRGEIPHTAPVDFDAILEAHLKELPRGTGKTKDAIRKVVRTAQKNQAITIRAALEDEYRPMLERERGLIQAERDKLIAIRQEVEAEKQHVQKISQGLTPIMTQDEFKMIRSLLHPDRHPEDSEKYNQAFSIFNRLLETINPNIPIDVKRKRGWGKSK